jgi:phenylpropionate dioxygenase-like ring-hydroxylating dioxygenase large terminal subunit
MGKTGNKNVIATDRYVDTENGTVNRRIFSDPDIYQQEMRQIFARSWNFMCHTSQIPDPGSYFLNSIGEDQVIIVRDREGEVNVFLNSCPHRGNTVCRAEQGKTSSFFCSYHGWNFDLDGRLLAVPGLDKYYENDLDIDNLGLARAAQVDIYRGFVFATLDPEAIPLVDFLGWVGRLSIDLVAERGEMEVVDGIQKNRIQCNWKLAVDNLFDWYHPKVSHLSAIRAGAITEESLFPMDQMVILGEYGHGIGGPGVSVDRQAQMDAKYQGPRRDEGNRGAFSNAWRASDKAKEQLGPIGIRSRGHPNLFPNVWVALGGNQLCLRIPKGPLETELWWFTLVEKSMSAEERREVVQAAIHFFGPAGLLEQDDGENWIHSTRTSRGTVTGERASNFSMRQGHDTVYQDGEQKSIETVVNEHGQLWTYRCWEEWMRAKDWDDLVRNHSPEPTGKI